MKKCTVYCCCYFLKVWGLFKCILTKSVLLTITPVLGFEPAWPWQHRPALGTVLLSHAGCKGHGGKHVRHVVALEAHLDLRARLIDITRLVASFLKLTPTWNHRDALKATEVQTSRLLTRQAKGKSEAPDSPMRSCWSRGHSLLDPRTPHTASTGRSTSASRSSCTRYLEGGAEASVRTTDLDSNWPVFSLLFTTAEAIGREPRFPQGPLPLTHGVSERRQHFRSIQHHLTRHLQHRNQRTEPRDSCPNQSSWKSVHTLHTNPIWRINSAETARVRSCRAFANYYNKAYPPQATNYHLGIS